MLVSIIAVMHKEACNHVPSHSLQLVILCPRSVTSDMADGMTFAIASQPGVGWAGERLGLGPALGSFVAVELDTYQNGGDPNNNHVGLDNITTTIATGNPAFTMASEVPFTVWVDYDGGTNSLKVYTSQNRDTKPVTPTLSTFYNISATLMPSNSSTGYFIGFTSATGAATTQYNVLSWCFTMGQCVALLS